MGKQNCKIGGRGEFKLRPQIERKKRYIRKKKRQSFQNREGARKEMVKGTSRLCLT